MKTTIRVDGVMVVVGLALVGGYILYANRQKFKTALDPTSHENIANKAVIAAVGEKTYADTADKVFGLVDLLNPFAPAYRKAYAKKVYGLE